MNKRTVLMIQKSIESYIERCMKNSFEAEGHKYDPSLWSFQYVIVRNDYTEWHLIPAYFRCKYERVRRRTNFRLSKNLYRNFNIHYGKTDDLRYIWYEEDSRKFAQIDPNYPSHLVMVNLNSLLI